MHNFHLTTHNLKKQFKQGPAMIEVLKGIDTQFQQGISYAITGPSGSGKSTFVHLLAGLDTPSEGAVLFNERNIAQFNESEREQFLNQSIGLVFQLPYLIHELTVIENVMVKGLMQHQNINTARQQALLLLARVGLEEKAYAPPASLSGGQQQRVALARALFNKPTFLIADEPTGNVDTNTGNLILDLLFEAQKEWNMGIIISTHDEYVAQRMKKVLHMKDGVLIKV